MTELSTPGLTPDVTPPHGDVDPSTAQQEPRSLLAEAWLSIRGKWLFWISLAIIVLFAVMAIAPGVFTSVNPRDAVLQESLQKPNGEHIFGRDLQGYDLYSRCIYGARASILVGVLTALLTGVLGTVAGLIAGYMGGLTDTLISRISEVFFAIPLLLGAIIFLSTFQGPRDPFSKTLFLIVVILAILGWPNVFRLMRSSVLQVKPNDYVQAARALGASPLRIAFKHILPNAIGPVIVVSTINLGVYIAAESALSFLGIGLQQPTVSWGQMIDEGSQRILIAPHVLLFPAAFLSLTVLGFIMLGDTIRDAFDPKSR